MSLGDFLRKQLIDVIQWTEEGDGVLAIRYPMRDMEIQYGARLTVRESQMAIFVNEGKIADQFGPGLYTLETQTLPLLTNLKHWYTGFESPFKSDVYFFATRIQTDQRWGTQQPMTVRDKDFGMVRMRGFGLYSYHLANPVLFHQKVSGTRDTYTVAEMGVPRIHFGLDTGELLGETVVQLLRDPSAFSRGRLLFDAHRIVLGREVEQVLGGGRRELGVALRVRLSRAPEREHADGLSLLAHGREDVARSLRSARIIADDVLL